MDDKFLLLGGGGGLPKLVSLNGLFIAFRSHICYLHIKTDNYYN